MSINKNNSLIVPEKTIAFFPIVPDNGILPFDLKDVGLFLKPLNTDHKRDWFSSNFYKCLPLSIGNMQGFVFSLPYSVDILWDGTEGKDAIKIDYNEDFFSYENINFIHLTSEFGHGILTIHFPLTLKTPPGVNLMTIAPPNFPVPGMSPMTGVIESDNLRFTFTLNLKIDIPNILIKILPNSPLIGIIPIPRYFCDSFELKNAYDLFDKDVVDNEKLITDQNAKSRGNQIKNNNSIDGLYFSGKDILGNKFKDHQLPKKYKS
jgi:hypothetical protein